MFADESDIERKFNAIITNLKSNHSSVLSELAKTELEKQFANIVKYLAFTACAAKAPVSQSLTKLLDDRVKIAGSAENVQRWMFWTVPQATFFANASSWKKFYFLVVMELVKLCL